MVEHFLVLGSPPLERLSHHRPPEVQVGPQFVPDILSYVRADPHHHHNLGSSFLMLDPSVMFGLLFPEFSPVIFSLNLCQVKNIFITSRWEKLLAETSKPER